MVYLYYILCLRYTILVSNPRYICRRSMELVFSNFNGKALLIEILLLSTKNTKGDHRWKGLKKNWIELHKVPRKFAEIQYFFSQAISYLHYILISMFFTYLTSGEVLRSAGRKPDWASGTSVEDMRESAKDPPNESPISPPPPLAAVWWRSLLATMSL